MAHWIPLDPEMLEKNMSPSRLEKKLGAGKKSILLEHELILLYEL